MRDFHPATLVPDERRLNFLPDLFGLSRLIPAEAMLYGLMDRLSPDYGGGFWDFYERDGRPLYLVPTSKPRYRIAWPGNGYEGEVSADAAGIIATLFALSHPRPAGASSAASLQDRAASQFGRTARRLFGMAQGMRGTLAETYLRQRGLNALGSLSALRFHPCCFYRPEDGGLTEQWPALLAAVTDLKGRQTGTHRTWLARDGSAKAPLDPPRRAMGDLLGHGVRFGRPRDALAAGEGIETVLSVRECLPGLPMLAALSAGHLGGVLFPQGLRRLYILRDRDGAGARAAERLAARARAAGIEPVALAPVLGDFNDDLRCLGREALWARVRVQLRPGDFSRFSSG